MKSIVRTVALVACLVPNVVAVPAIFAAEPSRNIETYVLFALTDLEFKGRNADPTRGFISGGNVGVNCIDDFDPLGPVMSLGANGAVVMSNGTQVVTDSGRINDNANVYDLFVNDRWGSTAPTIRHDGPLTFTPPIMNVLPPFPVCNPGTAPIFVATNGTLNLAPGSYGDVRVNDGGTLNLSAGHYQLNDLSCGRRVTIHTVAGVHVTIAETMTFNNESYVGPDCTAQFELCSVGVGPLEATVAFARKSIIYGRFWVPNGRINLGDATDLYGKFWADRISSDNNVNMELCGGQPLAIAPTTWSAIKTRIEN
jgi:hypothetical protein